VNLKRPFKLEIKQTYQKGWGVFATSPIYTGEILEECPILKLPQNTDLINSKVVIDYAFGYPQKNPQIQVLPLGFGSLYNHSDTPNAAYQHHAIYDEIFQFVSIKDINPGEEIYIYYGGDGYWIQRPYVKKI